MKSHENHYCNDNTQSSRYDLLLIQVSFINIPPHECTTEFLIVENNTEDTSYKWLNDVRSSMADRTVTHLLETNIGISNARNRALEYAIQGDADFLVFVDDDEQVEADWLVKLVSEQQRLDLDIVGSPVRPIPAKPNLNPWKNWSGRASRHTVSRPNGKQE